MFEPKKKIVIKIDDDDGQNEDSSELKKEKIVSDGKNHKYLCLACSYSFETKYGDKNRGIEPNIQLENFDDEWVCPLCESDKDSFEEITFLENLEEL